MERVLEFTYNHERVIGRHGKALGEEKVRKRIHTYLVTRMPFFFCSFSDVIDA